MRRSLLLALAAALLLLLHRGWPTPAGSDPHLLAAERLQGQLDRAHAELNRAAQTIAASAAAANADELWRITLPPSPLVVVVQRHGRTVLWQGDLPLVDSALASVSAAHLHLADGFHLHAGSTLDSTRVHTLLRVWHTPPFTNRYLQAGPGAGFDFPPGTMASTAAGLGPVLRDADGAAVFRLAGSLEEGQGQHGLRPWLLPVAFACALAAWWLLMFRVPVSPLSLLAFALPIILLRVATLVFRSAWGTPMDTALFDPSYFGSSAWMPSLGDLLVNALLALVIACFWRERMRAVPRAFNGIVLLAMGALVALAGQALSRIMISLVRDSRLELDLFHVQAFSTMSWIAMGTILVMLLAWAAIADAVLGAAMTRFGLKRALGAVVLFSCITAATNHLLGVYDLLLALLPACMLFPLLLLRTGRAPFVGALLLVVAPAFFTAHVLNRENIKRLAHERAALAEVSSAHEDPVVEVLFAGLSHDLRADPQVRALVAGRTPCSSTELDRAVRQAHATGYWERYDMRVHLFGPNGSGFCSTGPDAAPGRDQMFMRFQQGVPSAVDSALRSVHRPGEDALYIGMVPMPEAGPGCVLAVELRSRVLQDGLGFPELLLAGGTTTDARMERFMVARYERGVLATSQGAYAFPTRWQEPAPPEGYALEDRGVSLLAWGDLSNTLVVVGSRIPTDLDHATSFSYLFTMFALAAGVLLLLALLVGRVRMPAFGVAAKLRTGILLFAAVSLGLFIVGTRNALETRGQQRSARALQERGKGALTELRQTLGAEAAFAPHIVPYLEHLLVRLSNVFYADLTLYLPDGSLLASSREQVFNTGLLGQRMNDRAYRELAVHNSSFHMQEEYIGNARFRTAYLPFQNERGDVLAYLAMPYFARQVETDRERSAGDLAVVNLFTLLFLLSGVAAALISHWTTGPLQLLRAGLERIGLGQRNEPIVYSGQDELGQLVEVYNRKVEELRESAERLAASERESAWREMARQVAHEIKNPLTPMKLSIQHFQRSWDPNAENARERLDRFSGNLVEQIDALSRIAGEFSHFAQMPPAHPAVLQVAEVADAAVQLFAATPHCSITLEKEGDCTVLMDREHLLRCFNNLIKNATQAIPDDRHGVVHVRVLRRGAQVLATVEDNGAGIAVEAADQVFVPRFSTKSSGMGLGLPMVKRMVEHAGGQVDFTSEPGHGTCFTISLPHHRPQDTLAP